MTTLRAPYPYVGGKSMIVDTVWKAVGDVTTYVEPFAGSCAVLLARPQPFRGIEVINDANGYVCLAPSTKLLGGDLRWRRAGDVQVGDVLMGFDEHNGDPQTGVSRRADRPSFQPPTRMRRWRTTKVTNVRRVTRPSYRLVFEDGTEVVASEDHLWLAGKSKAGGRGARWISTKNLRADPNHRTHVMKLCDVTDQEKTVEGGWLGGFYDGEGHIRGKGPGWGLSVCQKVGPEADRVRALLHARGFDTRESLKNGKGRYQDVVSFEINGGMREILRFLMLARPERLIRNAMAVLNARSIYGRERQVVGLVEKHFLGPTEVMAIETESHTFVAEGLASHNCNFWRATQQYPERVAQYAGHPALENDLHARHRWLHERRDVLQAQLEGDPDWCDPKIAGWWLWGMCHFFTGAFCVRENPNRSKLLCDSNRGITTPSQDPYQWMAELRDRMRHVKVLCGDFKRALTPSVVTPNGGISGVFLDPPYDGGDTRVYGVDSASIFQETLNWAITNASPTVRVVLAGYDTRPMPEGWRELAWKGHGGHGRRKDFGANTNQDRERLWLSPSCINPESQPTSLDELLGM